MLFTLTLIVKGSWWVAATQPIIMTFGAAFAALDLDVQPIHLFDLGSWFKKDKPLTEEEL